MSHRPPLAAARRLPALLAAAALAAGAGLAPDSLAAEADEAAEAGILLFGNAAEPPSLDPHLNTSVNGNRVISALLEGLVAYHPSDDSLPEPGMAETWESDEDATVWTFHLREAQWSNGDLVAAQDFVYAFQRMLTPELGASYAKMLYALDGAEAFHAGQTDDFSEVGAKALDERTLRLELSGPTPHFLNMLKHHAWYPVHPPTIEAYGGMAKPDSNWTREAYVGNGPFVLEEWTINQIIAVRKNPRYWDADRVALEGIRFLPVENSRTEDRLFNTGGLHYANTIPSDLIPHYKEGDDPALRIEPYLGTYFYRFNTQRPPLDDPRVRQALSLAINRRALVRLVTKGGQPPAASFTPPGIAEYEPPERVAYNPRKARQLIAEAGYPDGEGLRPLRLVYNTSESHKDIAEAIQQMWRNVLGVETSLSNQEWKVYLSTVSQLDYDIARAAWIGDYLYPDTFLAMWQTGDGNNSTGWSSPEYDRLLQASFREGDPKRRLGLLRQAEEILLEALPIAPIYHYTRIYRLDPRVQGWHPKLLDNHPFKSVSFRSAPPEAR